MMHALVALTLALYPHASPSVVERIVIEATAQHVEPELALAVAQVESGMRGRNPLGYRACYRDPRGARWAMRRCVERGVHALAAVLRRHGRFDALAIYQCGRARCASGKRYARRVLAIRARLMRREARRW